MTSENPPRRVSQCPGTTSENTAEALADYQRALRAAPLAAETRRTYYSKVRGYLTWLAAADVDGDPLAQPRPRDSAVRDYRTHLVTVAKRAPRTINTALAAIDDFYTRRGLGPAAADRLDLPAQAPRALDAKTALRWVRAIATRPSPRDRVLALLPIYAGLRVSETVALDTDDVRLSARKGNLRVRGKGTTVRDLPIHPQLRTDLQTWLGERPGWPGADISPALLLNRYGQRLSVRGASDIIRAIAADANLDEEHITAHVGRHTFATQFPRRHRPGRRRRHARPRPPRHRSPLHRPQRRRPRTSPQSPAIRPLTRPDGAITRIWSLPVAGRLSPDARPEE